jgi:hypothetical protein
LNTISPTAELPTARPAGFVAVPFLETSSIRFCTTTCGVTGSSVGAARLVFLDAVDVLAVVGEAAAVSGDVP